MFHKVMFAALAMVIATNVQAKSLPPSAIEPLQLILYSGNRCQETSPALLGTPGLPVPLGVCVNLPFTFTLTNLLTNATYPYNHIDMVCAPPRHYDFGMASCTENSVPTGNNFENYCMTIPFTDAFSFRFRCYQGPPACKPTYETNKNRCLARIRGCDLNGVKLKWAGPGCRRKGRPVGDGGCQCDGYCGYTCKNACNRDGQCFWNATASTCYMKGKISPVPEFSTLPAPGGPIPHCSAAPFINVPLFLTNVLPGPVYVA